MGIDPMMYERISGRSADPTKRMGEVLSQNAKAKQSRDAMPKGVKGGFQTMRAPGMLGQLWVWWQNRRRARGG